MKIVKELNVTGIKPMSGCVCSSGKASAKGISGLWKCNCSCDHGTINHNGNNNAARDA